MAIATVPLKLAPTLGATEAIVKLEPLSGITYASSSAAANVWPNAQVQQIILSIGKEPSSAKIVLPVAESDNSLGQTSTEIVHAGSSNYKSELTKIKTPDFAGARSFLFSRVWIYIARKNISEQNEGSPLFVGYITDYDLTASGDGSTSMVITCQDARYFMAKAPVQGRIHFNNRANEIVYIRSSQPVFNEGRRPNRLHDTGSLLNSNQFPIFVDVDLNRFFDSPGNLEDRQYVADDELDDLSDGKNVPNPHARKWLPGHVWNYYRMMMDTATLQSRIDKPTSTEIGRTPDARDFPVDLSALVQIPALDEKTDDGAFRDFFRPRAQIGGATQTGTTSFVSGVGEFAANGMSVLDIFQEMCQRVGNFTLAAIYHDDGVMGIQPFRTPPAITTKDVKFGLRSSGAQVAKGAGKISVIKMKRRPRDDNQFPDAHSWHLRQSTDNYFNRFYNQGGQRFIQLTFSTFGTTEFPDHLDQVHAVYGPSNEWVPKTEQGSIRAGWTREDQIAWLAVFDAKDDQELFPDVFLSWIVPDNFDWLTIWNQAAATQGFRMFFEKERQHLATLVSAIFEKTRGIWRARKQQMPITLWRAYQGIPINAAGDEEKYGGDVGDPIDNNGRWFKRVPNVEILTDGRFGFKLDSSARRDQTFPFEDADATNGKATSPWSWNGESAFPAAFEMIWTVAVAVDEDLYDYKAIKDDPAELLLTDFGPPQEMHRNAGSEYQQHFITNSIIDVRGVKLEQPSFLLGGSELVAVRDDVEELAARIILNMNRHAKPDVEGDIALDRIRPEFIPGQMITQFDFGSSLLDIDIKAIISKVIHNFTGKNETIIQVATVR